MWECWLEQTVWKTGAQEKCIGSQESVKDLFLEVGIGKNGAGSPNQATPNYGFGFGLNATYATSMTLTTEATRAPRL